MCQLLGMNCNTPTDICFSFTGFQARGGLTDVHQDGWGIAFFEGKGVRQFLDPEPSASSQVAKFVKTYPIKSKAVVAHIRKATQGEISLENTHPFSRELWGYNWIFAHNGNIPNFNPEFDGTYTPIGNTDSERVFCWMMQELRRNFGNKYPGNDLLFATIKSISEKIGALGEFNFLMSNGSNLIAHCSTKLSYIIRRAPFKTARLKDQDVTVDFSQVTTDQDQVAIIATTPLTDDEPWTTMEPGTIWLFEEGHLRDKKVTIRGPEKK